MPLDLSTWLTFRTRVRLGGSGLSRTIHVDWTIGDDGAGSIYEKPVAFINTSAAPTGAADVHESLRKVLGYTHATVVESACASIPVPCGAVADGLIDDPSIRRAIIRSLQRLVKGARGA